MHTTCPTLKLNHLFSLRFVVDQPIERGDSDDREKRTVPILQGTVWGPNLKGTVLPEGNDMMFLEEKSILMNSHYTIKTDDGAFIHIRTEGVRRAPPEVLEAMMEGGPVDPGQSWFHVHINVATGHEKYKWINDRVVVGHAMRGPREIAYDAYVVNNDC